MSVVVIGLNHRSVPLDVLEQMSIGDDEIPKVLSDLTASPDVSEAVVVSTCNRTEIYARAERFHPAFGDIRDVMARHSGLPLDAFAEHLAALVEGKVEPKLEALLHHHRKLCPECDEEYAALARALDLE